MPKTPLRVNLEKEHVKKVDIEREKLGLGRSPYLRLLILKALSEIE